MRQKIPPRLLELVYGYAFIHSFISRRRRGQKYQNLTRYSDLYFAMYPAVGEAWRAEKRSHLKLKGTIIRQIHLVEVNVRS